MRLDMTPSVAILGSFLAFMLIVVGVVFYPLWEYSQNVVPSPEFSEPYGVAEERGRQIYIDNGCQYCHSQYVRPQDWDYGSERVAQEGDYYYDEPPLLGSERQGPDLSQEGGLRSDGWHWAHFSNPRSTRPDSIMPPFHWLAANQIEDLTVYVQGRGGTDGDARTARQREWRDAAWEAYSAGPAINTEWLHAHVPSEWMDMPNPYPADQAAIDRGQDIYLRYCIGCHGPVGDGRGPGGELIIERNRDLIARAQEQPGLESDFAPEAPPFNFTYLRENWINRNRTPIGGMIYYQVMNGITGTSMPAFKHELESARIWDVANYLAVNFVGHYGVGGLEPGPRAIPASYEPRHPDEFQPIPLAEVIANIPVSGEEVAP